MLLIPFSRSFGRTVESVEQTMADPVCGSAIGAHGGRDRIRTDNPLRAKQVRSRCATRPHQNRSRGSQAESIAPLWRESRSRRARRWRRRPPDAGGGRTMRPPPSYAITGAAFAPPESPLQRAILRSSWPSRLCSFPAAPQQCPEAYARYPALRGSRYARNRLYEQLSFTNNGHCTNGLPYARCAGPFIDRPGGETNIDGIHSIRSPRIRMTEEVRAPSRPHVLDTRLFRFLPTRARPVRSAEDPRPARPRSSG